MRPGTRPAPTAAAPQQKRAGVRLCHANQQSAAPANSGSSPPPEHWSATPPPAPAPAERSHAPFSVRSPQHEQQQQRQQATGQQFGERAAPINNHQMIRIHRIERGCEDGVAAVDAIAAPARTSTRPPPPAQSRCKCRKRSSREKSRSAPRPESTKPEDKTGIAARHSRSAPAPPSADKRFRASTAPELQATNKDGTPHRAPKEFRRKKKGISTAKAAARDTKQRRPRQRCQR